MIPNSRAAFKEYCLRKLGKPVIKIEVSDEQADDRIDEALLYYADFHYDGAEKTYFSYQIQPADIVNGYIVLPDNIIGAVSIFDQGSAFGQGDIFNIRYQIALNDLYSLTSVSMVPYYMTFQQIQFLEQLLVGKQPIRYNRMNNRLYIDQDWSAAVPGQYYIVECYSVIDPAEYPKVWGDRWLAKYATALIKRNWGSNLKKFGDMPLPGSTKFNGQKIYDEADKEITDLEAEMASTYSMPPDWCIG